MLRTNLTRAYIYRQSDPGRQDLRLGGRFGYIAPRISGSPGSRPLPAALDTLRPIYRECAVTRLLCTWIAHGRKAAQAKAGNTSGRRSTSPNGGKRPFDRSQQFADYSSPLRGSTTCYSATP